MRNQSETILEYTGTRLPDKIASNTIYSLLPNNPNDAYYRERTDRNIGWITTSEQEILRKSVVGIAGTGGMGGLLCSTLIRAGIGEVRISDMETFDVSNINRQFGATRNNIQKNKAIETAKMIRDISDDVKLVVYPQGITEDTVDHFASGCSLICDEIEAFALDARLLLHERARVHGVPVFNCNSIGFSTNLFLYTPTGVGMDTMTGYTYTQAKEAIEKISQGDIESRKCIIDAMLRAVVPKLPEYREDSFDTDHAAFMKRLQGEQKVSIIATNPTLAAGFLANRILLYLLRNSENNRTILETPEVPGYLHFDSAHMSIQTCTGK